MGDIDYIRVADGSIDAGKIRNYLLLLKNNPNYRKFWLAGVISQIGDWFNYIAIFVLLINLTGSGEAISWFLIAKFLPTFFLGPITGVVADRFDRKKIIIFCDLVRVLVVFSFLFIREAEQVYLVFVLTVLQESLWSFWQPAREASLPDICNKEEIALANGLSGASWSVMLALGAAAGGFVTSLFGWQTAIVVDALTFVASALVMMRVNLPHRARKEKVNASFSWQKIFGWHDLLAGFRYVQENRQVAGLLMVKSGWALAGGVLVLLTVFAETIFSEKGQGGISGFFYSMRGVGAAIGPILAWKLLGDGNRAMQYAIGWAFYISSIAYLCFSYAPNFLLAGLCVLVGHIGGSIQWIFSTTLLHRTVAPEFRGRVFAAEMALLTLVLSLSSWVTGVALDAGFNPRHIGAFLALLFILPGSLWFFYIKDRELEDYQPQ